MVEPEYGTWEGMGFRGCSGTYSSVQYGTTETATVIWRHICWYMTKVDLTVKFGWHRGF